MELNGALRIVAELMALSARTAPKTAGKDHVVLKLVEGGGLEALGKAMRTYGQQKGKTNFDRDGANVAKSGALLLVGIKDAGAAGLNCGACGSDCCSNQSKREGPEFAGGFCSWRLVDLGIAVGSAVKTAGILNADNRVMYRAGVVARQMGLIDADVCLGIPLSATGKSIYFDR